MYDIVNIVIFVSFFISIASLVFSIAMMYINLDEKSTYELEGLSFFNRLCCFFVFVETKPYSLTLKGLKYRSVANFSAVIALFSSSAIIVVCN